MSAPSSFPSAQLLVENSQDGILAFDRECRYTYWNAAMEKLSGIPSAQVAGKKAAEIFPFLQETGELKYFELTLRGESVVSSLRPFHIPSSGKSGFFEGYYSPLRNERNEVVGGMCVVRDVTERARRQTNDLMYERIAESISQIVWVNDETEEVRYYNKAWYDYTGIDPNVEDPMFANRWADFLHPEDLDVVRAAGQRSRQDGTPFEAEYRLKNKHGEYRWFWGRSVAVDPIPGNVLRRIGTATDIHSQKMAAIEAKTFNERFRRVVEQMPFAFVLYSPDGTFDYANPAWERIWIGNPEKMRGFNILQDPNMRKIESFPLIERAFRGEAITLPDMYYQPTPDGRMGRAGWIRTTFFPVSGMNGNLIQVAVVVEDISSDAQARIRAEFLSEASKRLSQSLDSHDTLSSIAHLCVEKIADFCIIDLLDSDGNFRRVEVVAADPEQAEMAQKIRGLPPHPSEPDHPPMQAHRLQKTVHISNSVALTWLESAQLNPDRRALMQKGHHHSIVSIPLRARGHILGVLTVTSIQASRVFDESKIAWLEELADRTAIAIDNANLYLASTQAVVARDTFMSTASHELKTPLTALQLQLQVVSRLVLSHVQDPEAAERAKQLSVQTDRQIHRLARLVDDMLDISRIASGKLKIEPESIDLTELAQEVCARLQPLAIDFDTNIEFAHGKPVFGEWDGVRIEQVLNNLLSNAFRYGGKKPVQVRVWEQGESAYISVRDWGRGIPKVDQARIFERFERAVQNERSGFGLGLYIAREIVMLHGGTLEVQSEEGQGSTFTLQLPLHTTIA